MICPNCGYIAHSRNDLAQHTAKHLDDRRYMCMVCKDYDDHSRKGVHTHIKRSHLLEQLKNPCDVNSLVLDREALKKTVTTKRPKIVSFDVNVNVVNIQEHPKHLNELLLQNGCSIVHGIEFESYRNNDQFNEFFEKKSQ